MTGVIGGGARLKRGRAARAPPVLRFVPFEMFAGETVLLDQLLPSQAMQPQNPFW